MNEDQKLLTEYLIQLGASMAGTLTIVSMLDSNQKLEEMLMYIAENKPLDVVKLYEIACEIAGEENLLNE